VAIIAGLTGLIYIEHVHCGRVWLAIDSQEFVMRDLFVRIWMFLEEFFTQIRYECLTDRDLSLSRRKDRFSMRREKL
jgi:hypothetical protein